MRINTYLESMSAILELLYVLIWELWNVVAECDIDVFEVVRRVSGDPPVVQHDDSDLT